MCDTHSENGGEETLHWLPINEINMLHLYTEFFKTEIKPL